MRLHSVHAIVEEHDTVSEGDGDPAIVLLACMCCTPAVLCSRKHCVKRDAHGELAHGPLM